MKDGVSQIIVNVAAQKDGPKGYQILNRAIFYVSRLISSQKERDFENSNYDDIKRVYSIWVPSVDKGTHGSAPQICDSASLLSLGVPQYAAFQCLAESQI